MHCRYENTLFITEFFIIPNRYVIEIKLISLNFVSFRILVSDFCKQVCKTSERGNA